MGMAVVNLDPAQRRELRQCMMSSIRLKKLMQALNDMRIDDFNVDTWSCAAGAEVMRWLMGDVHEGTVPAVILEDIRAFARDGRVELNASQLGALNNLLNGLLEQADTGQTRTRRFVLPDGQLLSISAYVPPRREKTREVKFEEVKFVAAKERSITITEADFQQMVQAVAPPYLYKGIDRSVSKERLADKKGPPLRLCPTCSHPRHHAHQCTDEICPCSTPMDK